MYHMVPCTARYLSTNTLPCVLPYVCRVYRLSQSVRLNLHKPNQPHPMKSLSIGLVVLILATLGVAYLVQNDTAPIPEDSSSTTTPPTQNGSNNEPSDETSSPSADIPNNFRHHAEPEQQYRIALPYDVDVSSPQPGITRYRYVGPNNESSSEITDGYTITIAAEAVDSADLDTLESELAETNETVEELRRTTIAGESALRYVTKSALGNRPITHYAFIPGNGYRYDLSISTYAQDNAYQSTVDTIASTLRFIDTSTAVALRSRIVPIAMLDYGEVGGQYVRESSGKERGCDKVVLIEHVLDEATTMPLTASLEQLFAHNKDTVGGWQNFIASRNDTLSFESATVSDGTANVYLAGELGPLGGVCDNPRAAIQIEETALAYDTVDTVKLYLNGEQTDLTPSGRGE